MGWGDACRELQETPRIANDQAMIDRALKSYGFKILYAELSLD
jgi:hypothetical protein